MNQEVVSFKSEYILEEMSKIISGFAYNITHNSSNDVSGIIWMTSFMRDNFGRFSNYLSIDYRD